MRVRTMIRAMTTLAAIGGAVGIALSALAADLSGSGLLEDVSLDDRTVTVGTQILAVDAETRLLDGRGQTLDLRGLERELGEWVQYSATQRRTQPLLEVLQLDLEDMPVTD